MRQETVRAALAGLLHDVGKFTWREEIGQRLFSLLQDAAQGWQARWRVDDDRATDLRLVYG